MSLTALASALLWVLTLATPPTRGQADLIEDLAIMQTPASARFTIQGRAEAMRQRVDLRGSGAFAQPDRFRLSLEAPAMGQSLEQVVVDRKMYMRTTFDRDWTVIDLDEKVGALGLNLPATATGATPDRFSPETLPPEAQQVLAEISASFRTVGTERLGERVTRHERAQIDLLELASRLGGAPEQASGLTSFQLTTDYWIGTEDRYLHQLQLGLSIRAKPEAGMPATDLSAELTLSFNEFDRPVEIIAPQVGPRATPTPTPRPAPVQAPVQLPRATPTR